MPQCSSEMPITFHENLAMDLNLFDLLGETIPSFHESLLLIRYKGNKAYPLRVGSVTIPVYCHMTDDLGSCGGGGWTLVMKIDGNKVVNSKNSSLILKRGFASNFQSTE